MVARALGLGSELDWLPDDTEEDILGTSVHQTVIVGLDHFLAYVRHFFGLSWFIGNQLKLIIPRQGGGTYQPSPDIIVHATLGPVDLTSLSVRQHGPPALAVEIASPGTAREHDLNTLEPGAKPAAYAQAGIPEYLVYDPTGLVIPGRMRAWRLGAADQYVLWEAEADGRWHSALGISFAPEVGGVLLRVYDRDGRLVPTPLELAAQLAEQREEALAREARIAELEAALRRRNDNR
jgi:Uma2 family endonuclease